MTGSIQIINGNIQIQGAGHQPITLHSMHWLIATIRNLFACLFPCCCHSAVKVKMGDTVTYLSSAELNKKLKHSGKDDLEEERLQQIALNAFSAETPVTDPLKLQITNTKPEPSSSQYHTVGKVSELSVISAEAARLTTEFMRKRAQILKTNPHSGYHVYFAPDPSDGKMHVEIHPMGWKGETQIRMPVKSAKESADLFEQTRQLGIPLCKELSELIAQYGMYAIFSNSDNILIIPDSTQKGIDPHAFPHIFHLSETQLQSVIAANLTAEAFLRSAFPTYKGNCFAFHVGSDGSQTESLLHGRHTHLPDAIKLNSQNGGNRHNV